MTSFRFPYTRKILFPTHKAFAENKISYYPNVKMALRNGELKADTHAYIDTGAQWCLFDKSMSVRIGIKDYKNTTEKILIKGVGGDAPCNTAYFHKVELLIYTSWEKPREKNPLVYETKVGFLENAPPYNALLGIYGFLDHFKFTSNVLESYFELEYLL